jgi:hypothetical protein
MQQTSDAIPARRGMPRAVNPVGKATGRVKVGNAGAAILFAIPVHPVMVLGSIPLLCDEVGTGPV